MKERDRDDLEEKIRANIEYLDDFFVNFDEKLRHVKSKKQAEFHVNELPVVIGKCVDEIESKFVNSVNDRRTCLIDSLQKYFQSDMRHASCQQHNCKTIKEFSASKKKSLDCTYLIGSLVYGSKFSILKKLKYMDYLNQLENKIELVGEVNRVDHVRSQILSLNRLFIYIRTPDAKTFFKIFDSKCKELDSMEISEHLTYKNILTLNSQIVTLFYDQITKYYLLSVYDDELNLVKRKRLKRDINMCSLSKNEIICWDVKNKRCLVFDFDLKEISSFGQSDDPSAPFYFSDGIIIEASTELILFYYYSEDTPKHFIKIIDRQTGLLNGVIDIDFEYFSRIFLIDTESNILFKPLNPTNLLKYYDSRGNIIGMFSNNEFAKFRRIELTKSDELICFDKVDNKIFFL